MPTRIILFAVLLFASAARAQVIFSDNFNADLRGLSKTTFVGGWTVSNGRVDVIGAGPGNEPGAGSGQAGDATIYNYFPGNGNFINLDGYAGAPVAPDAGIFTKLLTLTGGTTYSATFQLAGSQRGATETINVDFGTTSATYSYGSSTPFTASTLNFTPTATGSYALRFFELGASNNAGLLLDNITVASVPEPAGLSLAALAGLALVARRSRARGRFGHPLAPDRAVA